MGDNRQTRLVSGASFSLFIAIALVGSATPVAGSLLIGSSPNQWTARSEPSRSSSIGGVNESVVSANNQQHRYASNVFEAISNVGKAIQQQIGAEQIQIITSPNSASTSSHTDSSVNTIAGNNKQNEYRSIGLMSAASEQISSSNATLGAATGLNIRDHSELLRQEIVHRAGQLQQVVGGSLELLKNNGDLIVRRLLEQLNTRLDLAKTKAERILSEPATNEAALRGLAAVNQGLNNLNNIIGNIVARLDLGGTSSNATSATTGVRTENNPTSIQQTLSQSAASALATANNLIANNGLKERFSSQPIGSLAHSQAGQQSLLDANRLRANLHQISQQFSAALNTTQLQQVLSPLRQRTAAIGSNGAALSRSSLAAKLEALRLKQSNLNSQNQPTVMQAPTVRA